MKITLKKIDEIHEAGKDFGKDTKIGFAYDKFMKRAKEALDHENKKNRDIIEDLRIDLCSVDDKNNIIFEKNEDGSKDYKFSKENLKILTIKSRALEIIELEIEFKALLSIPDGLTDEQIQLFSGILIPEVEKTEE